MVNIFYQQLSKTYIRAKSLGFYEHVDDKIIDGLDDLSK